eukprot:gene5175-4745_t
MLPRESPRSGYALARHCALWFRADVIGRRPIHLLTPSTGALPIHWCACDSLCVVRLVCLSWHNDFPVPWLYNWWRACMNARKYRLSRGLDYQCEIEIDWEGAGMQERAQIRRASIRYPDINPYLDSDCGSDRGSSVDWDECAFCYEVSNNLNCNLTFIPLLGYVCDPCLPTYRAETAAVNAALVIIATAWRTAHLM